MRDLDELEFMEKSPLIKCVINDLDDGYGIYNDAGDTITLVYRNKDLSDPRWFAQFIYVINHEFFHRILNHVIDAKTCRKFDRFTKLNALVDFENLLPKGFVPKNQ